MGYVDVSEVRCHGVRRGRGLPFHKKSREEEDICMHQHICAASLDRSRTTNTEGAVTLLSTLDDMKLLVLVQHNISFS